jgi:hypothetical protein
MTSRPLYRWKSLWLGLFAVMFLGWAWRDSIHWETRLRYQESSLSHAGSGISLTQLGRITSGRPRWDRRSIDGSPRDAMWQEARLDAPEFFRVTDEPGEAVRYYPLDRSTGDYGFRNGAARHFSEALFTAKAGAWAIYLPHWLFLVLFIVPWSVFLAWRWWRMKRVAAGMAEEPDRGSI